MGQALKTILITFDVDLINYITDLSYSEMELPFQLIFEELSKFPRIQTTWFFRIDSQVKELFGDEDYIFLRYQKELKSLTENGHEIGWHHHAYTFLDDKWIPEKNIEKVLLQIKKSAPIARNYDLEISRMGWGRQSNEITNFLEKSGFKIDSSAIPRPIYPWDNGLKDWTGCPAEPFYPAKDNYKAKGTKRELIQIPISTVNLPFEGDTIPNVIRYINPAYKSNIFNLAIESFKGDVLTTITHPYEIMNTSQNVESNLSFSIEVFRENLKYLNSLTDVNFKTISSFNRQLI